MLTSWALRNGSIVGQIDEVAVVGGDVVLNQAIPRGADVSFRGWLLNGAGDRQPDGLEIRVGPGRIIVPTLGFARPDVASVLATNVINSGFYGVGSVAAPCGVQPVLVWARFGDERLPLEGGGTVEVADVIDPLAGLTPRDGGWAGAADGFMSGDRQVDSVDDGGTTIVRFDRPTSLRGWCLDLNAGRPAVAVVARMGGSYLKVIDGIDRPDAAKHHGVPHAAACGFHVPAVPPLAGIGEIELFLIFEDGSYAALPVVRFRQPEPISSHALPTDASIEGVLDELRVGEREVEKGGNLELRGDDVLLIRGWAVDTVGPRLAGAVEIEISGTCVAQARRGQRRLDIANHLGNSAVSDCEFIAEVLVRGLEPRTHTMEIWALSARRDARALIASQNLVVHREGPPQP